MNTVSNASMVSSALTLLLSLTKKISDKRVEVFSGYPANCTTWLTIYHRRKSDSWSFEWYDKSGCRRPAALGDVSVCLMREVTDRGASDAEHMYARRLLEKTGFYDA